MLLFRTGYHTSMKYVGSIRRESVTGPYSTPRPLTKRASRKAIARVTTVAGRAPGPGAPQSGGPAGHGGVRPGQTAGTPLCYATTVCEFEEGVFRRYEIQPEDFGFTRCTHAEIAGGTTAENAAITQRCCPERPVPGVCLLLKRGAACISRASRLDPGGIDAAERIDSGAALATLST